MKRSKAIGLFLLILVTVIVWGKSLISKDKDSVSKTTRISTKNLNFKTTEFKFDYEEKFSEIQFENLHLTGTITDFGVSGYDNRAMRAFRFENITNSVEDIYNLPKGIILAMIMEESNGVDLLPNGLGDGGFGLCHMQSVNAKDFGLKVYQNCNAMVCNGKDRRSCLVNGQKANHAKGLKNLIVNNNYNRKKVIKYDDRLHPIKNIDAVGRMLIFFINQKPIKNLDPLQSAICRYAGSYNYKAYWRDIQINMKLLNDSEFRDQVEEKFNKYNPNLLINGKPGDFKMYLKVSQEQNYNYGLEEYLKQHPKYESKNSKKVVKLYKDYFIVQK